MIKTLSLMSLVLLAACSTEGKVTSLSTGAAIPRAASWALAVSGCPEAAQCDEVRTSIAARLVGTGLAERIVNAGQPADLSLEVRVSDVRAVPGAVRVLFGVMAGRNSLTSTDTLRDRQGTVLRTFQVESASASHPFSGESGISDAYRQFANDTVSALR